MEKYLVFMKLFRDAQRPSSILAFFKSRWYSYLYLLVISTQCNNSLASAKIFS